MEEPCSNLRRHRHCLPRSPIGRSGPPDQYYARLHLALLTTIGQGSGAGGGLARLRGGFDAVVQRGDIGHARTGARKPGAERERSASKQAMPMRKCELCMRAMK
eukprot:6175083-Pleurochrysis_carterae.AAC.2